VPRVGCLPDWSHDGAVPARFPLAVAVDYVVVSEATRLNSGAVSRRLLQEEAAATAKTRLWGKWPITS
jgi:hypothetical protein